MNDEQFGTTVMANKENKENKENSMPITLHSYMQTGPGSSQRDDGTQIWQQNGQKPSNSFTQMTADMYGRGAHQQQAMAAPQMMFAVDMNDYNTTYGAQAASYQPMYQYSYPAPSQQFTSYTQESYGQNPQIAYAASIPSAPMNAFTNPNNYSANATFAHPPPFQQPKNSGVNGQVAGSQMNPPAVGNPHLQQQLASSNTYYVHPYNQSAGSAISQMHPPTAPTQGQVMAGNKAVVKSVVRPAKLNSVFDTGSENLAYTASWVSSTSSIPPDLKISPDHISNSGVTPAEYPCWTAEQLPQNISHQRIRQSASVDEFAAGASATSGFSPPSTTNSHLGQHNTKSNLISQSQVSYAGAHSQTLKPYAVAQPCQQNAVPARAIQSNDSVYTRGHIHPPHNGAHAMSTGESQATINSCPEATTWADMVKRSGNCSIGETRVCNNKDNYYRNAAKGNPAYPKQLQTYSKRNGDFSKSGYGTSNMDSTSLAANSVHDSGYTGSCIQYNNRMATSGAQKPLGEDASQNRPRHYTPIQQNAPAPTAQPAKWNSSVNGQAYLGQNIMQQQQRPVYAEGPSYKGVVAESSIYPNVSSTLPFVGYDGQTSKALQPNVLNNPMIAFQNRGFPTFPAFPSIPPYLAVSRPTATLMPMQDEKFKDTWLDQRRIPLKQIVSERMLGGYINAHNNAVNLTRNVKFMDHGSHAFPYHGSGNGSLLATAIQALSNNGANFSVSRKMLHNGEYSKSRAKVGHCMNMERAQVATDKEEGKSDMIVENFAGGEESNRERDNSKKDEFGADRLTPTKLDDSQKLEGREEHSEEEKAKIGDERVGGCNGTELVAESKTGDEKGADSKHEADESNETDT